MTDAECTVILAEFRKLTLGPELSAALDHAIGALARHPAFMGPLTSPTDGRPYSLPSGNGAYVPLGAVA